MAVICRFGGRGPAGCQARPNANGRFCQIHADLLHEIAGRSSRPVGPARPASAPVVVKNAPPPKPKRVVKSTDERIAEVVAAIRGGATTKGAIQAAASGSARTVGRVLGVAVTRGDVIKSAAGYALPAA